MPRATTHLKDRIAVVFDFDLTLGEDSLDVLLGKLGVDPEAFRRERVDPLDAAGWDHLLARVKALVDLSDERDGAVTESLLEETGRDTPLFEGVGDLFDRLRDAADAVAPGVRVEFYVLTAGFAEVPGATPIAHQFERIWGGAGHFADDGRLDFPKRVVTYPEKVRYLLALAKGLGEGGDDAPSDVYRDVPEADWHVPFDQMVYVGDGSSDLPAFDLMSSRGGVAVGVVGPEGEVSRWGSDMRVHADRRVQNLARADYTEGSELLRSLTLAVESVAKLVALRRLGAGQ
jgi:phosphoglycolate phosphatase-like HAD superfamily hydrolase